MAVPVKTYCWRAQANFGDALGVHVLRKFSDADPVLSPPHTAEAIVTGSILHHMPQDWHGFVLGTGSLYPDSEFPRQATYMALRGPLTAKLVYGSDEYPSDIALGDPGLLANELVTPGHRTWDLGIVPHWSDTELAQRFMHKGALVIDVAADPLLVVKQISECKGIVSSSLHGIIVADSLGIPRRTEMTPGFARDGGDWKFRDHNAAVNLPFKVGEWQKPVFSLVEDRQHELYDVFRSYGNYVKRQSWAASRSHF